jgi:hypothetical protein
MNHAAHLRVTATLILTLASLFPINALAQGREHLTPEEIEFIREAQQLDMRTSVFIKAAERRLLLIIDANSKPGEKDKGDWGEIKGTRSQLLRDVFKIYDEAIVNIDDAALRDPKSALLVKSLGMLAGAATRLLPRIAPIRESAQTVGEREAVDEVIEKAQEIIAAAKRHGADENAAGEKAGKKGVKQN